MVNSPTFGVGPSELPVLGCIDLPLMLKGTSPQNREELFTSVMMRFIVIDVPSSYNTILGRQTQGNLHICLNLKYLTVTFTTKEGDAEIFIDQSEVRRVFTKARQSPAEVQVQTSATKGAIMTGEETAKKGAEELEKVETEDV